MPLVLPPTAPSITRFDGAYRWLSNFWPVTIEVPAWGLTFPSVEHAYQAAKCDDPSERVMFTVGTAGQAKRLGQRVAMRPDFPSQRVAIMDALLKRKFRAGTPLAHQLLATGEAQLVEGNTWGDTFWGVCNGKGMNQLGVLLMHRRAQLQALHPVGDR